MGQPSLSQTASLSQTLTPQALQTLSVLAMKSSDLADFIREEAERNPALTVTYPASYPSSYRTSRNAPRTAGGMGDTGDFEAFLENQSERPESIREHLLRQVGLLRLSAKERALCERIIGNLDDAGFHRLPPDILFGGERAVLEKCLFVVRALEPEGCACTHSEESLLIQAQQKFAEEGGGISSAVQKLCLFLLNGNLPLISPPEISSVAKKLKHSPYDAPTDENTIEKALRFIRSLEPFPARGFSGSGETKYIAPDIFIDTENADANIEGENIGDDEKITVRFADEFMPHVSIDENFDSHSFFGKKVKKANAESLVAARQILFALQSRKQTILGIAHLIAQKQAAFFLHGTAHLSALKMSEAAAALGVHESTISRAANGKYIQCRWGLFEMRFFFNLNADVKNMIYRIIEQHNGKISSQKIADELNARGVKIARRTVAKLRKL